MGCGGSKHDVATGNLVSTGKLSQKELANIKSNISSTTIHVSTIDDSLKSMKEKADIINANGSLEANEKSTITMMGIKVVDEEKLETNETPNEYLSPRKDVEIVEADVGSEGVDSNMVRADGVKELKESETKAWKEEKEKISMKNDDDGDSIGKHSNDFKEILFVEEMNEGEVVIVEKNIIGDEIVNSSSAQ